ncbi:hypothetical protein PSACC_01808 [Paramicrosporidium saccamoebae]|uniref:Serine aminopeptidase S33 domain-containing protein n=1 Tax=Paramicrosporidium saccamoebae TaxID=1246581 RepID=A0A2H9TKV1_9FUNG|nr:hypothetical protein PSACC_01808 [Paramicrosporidium saccamoebae]
MKLFALAVFLGVASAKNLKWETYKPKDVDATKYIITAAKLNTGQSHETRVVRFSRGHPSAHIFLLPPAPGQGAKYWESEVEKLRAVYGEDFVLYAVDLRGTTNGTPFFDESSGNWNSLDEDLKSQSGKLSISSLNVSGMASDLERLVNRVKDDPGFAGKVYLHARSFGALIAKKVLESSDKTYSAVVFESSLVPGSWTHIQNDSSFLKLCESDDFCRHQFNGMSPLQMRNAVASIGSPGYNECSTALMETLKKESIGLLPSDASDWVRVQEFLQPFFQGKIQIGDYHSAMITLPFLSATYLCPSVDTYKKDILPKMIKFVKDAKNPFSRYTTFGSEVDINRFANAYLMMYEVFNMGLEKDHPCQGAAPLGLASPCILYKYYHKYIKQFKKILGKHSHDYSSVKNSNTKMFFIGGALDLVTPLSTTSEFHDKSTGMEKRLLKFQNLGHHPLNKGACAREIGREILGKAGSGDTDACMKRANAEKLDWKMPKISYISSWWSGKELAPSTTVPPKVDVDDGKSKTKALYYVALVVGIVAVLAVTGHVCYTLYTRRKARNDDTYSVA